MIVCKSCYGPVRQGSRGEYYHSLPGYPQLETLAKEVTDVDEQQAQAARPSIRRKEVPPATYVDVPVPGF